tara:strand:+ start:1532 stop:1951 length:420 start_codon:yes stop_codon:yes gene_type:complete
MDSLIHTKGGLAVDDRGTVSFVNDFDFKNVKRFYQVTNHRRGFIRAWHGHENEAKYVYVAKGSAKVAAVQEEGEEPTVRVLSDKTPSVLYIPPGYYNGFQTLEEDTIIMFFSTASLDESLGDDMRKDWLTWDVWEDDFR